MKTGKLLLISALFVIFHKSCEAGMRPDTDGTTFRRLATTKLAIRKYGKPRTRDIEAYSSGSYEDDNEGNSGLFKMKANTQFKYNAGAGKGKKNGKKGKNNNNKFAKYKNSDTRNGRNQQENFKRNRKTTKLRASNEYNGKHNFLKDIGWKARHKMNNIKSLISKTIRLDRISDLDDWDSFDTSSISINYVDEDFSLSSVSKPSENDIVSWHDIESSRTKHKKMVGNKNGKKHNKVMDFILEHNFRNTTGGRVKSKCGNRYC